MRKGKSRGERLIERYGPKLEPVASLMLSVIVSMTTYRMRDSFIILLSPLILTLLGETIALTILSTRLITLSRKKGAVALVSVLIIGLMLAMVNDAAHTYEPMINQPYSPIYDSEELVRALRGRRIAVHGYVHVDPVTGTTDYEFKNLGETETRRRVVEGIQILEKADLEPSFYLAPGEFSTPILVRIIGEETDLALLGEGGEGQGRKYTWMWRDGVSQEEYDETLSQIRGEMMPMVIIHIQDWNKQTASLFEDYLKTRETPLVRVDDVDVNTDVEAVEEIKALFRDSVVFAIIPLAVKEAPRIFSVISDVNFILFLLFFEAPLVFFTIWYLLLRRRVKVV